MFLKIIAILLILLDNEKRFNSIFYANQSTLEIITMVTLILNKLLDNYLKI